MKSPTAVGVGDGRKYKSIGGQFGELHERSLGIGDGPGPVTNTLHLGPRICMHGGSMLHQNGEYIQWVRVWTSVFLELSDKNGCRNWSERFSSTYA